MPRKRKRSVTPPPPPELRGDRPEIELWLVPLLLAIVGLFLYAPSFSSPFVFDGTYRIRDNPEIRQLWPPWGWLTYDRRPVAYFTFAVNYALHGLDVWGYHAANLFIHVCAACTLFGVARRTLRREEMPPSLRASATVLAAAVALLWMAHPLQTQSVTYLVQRIESLMGLFFLLTLYAFIRAVDAQRPRLWYTISVACCLLGTLTKEVAAMAPLVVLWYDRAIVARGFREIWRERRWYYAALVGTWAVLGALMVVRWSTYSGRAGWTAQSMTPWQYALTQPGVIVHYLRLSFWPVDQCIDYVWPMATRPEEIVPPLVLLLAMLGLTIWCIFRKPRLSFLGGWFFLILAPTSSIVPIADLAFEHRMYLPLAAVVAVTVLGVYAVCVRLLGSVMPAAAGRVLFYGIVAVAAFGLGRATLLRNEVYQSELTLWRDVLEVAPHNPRAHSNYAVMLHAEARFDEAIHHFRRAIAIDPQFAEPYAGLGRLYADLGRTEEAIAQYHRALELRPNSSAVLSSLGTLLGSAGRMEEGIALCRRAVNVDLESFEAHSALGMLLSLDGQLDAAVEEYLTAVKLQPYAAGAFNNLGLVYHRQQRVERAEQAFRRALDINPYLSETHTNLGKLLLERGNRAEAAEHFRLALELNPGNAEIERYWQRAIGR